MGSVGFLALTVAATGAWLGTMWSSVRFGVSRFAAFGMSRLGSAGWRDFLTQLRKNFLQHDSGKGASVAESHGFATPEMSGAAGRTRCLTYELKVTFVV